MYTVEFCKARKFQLDISMHLVMTQEDPQGDRGGGVLSAPPLYLKLG